MTARVLNPGARSRRMPAGELLLVSEGPCGQLQRVLLRHGFRIRRPAVDTRGLRRGNPPTKGVDHWQVVSDRGLPPHAERRGGRDLQGRAVHLRRIPRLRSPGTSTTCSASADSTSRRLWLWPRPKLSTTGVTLFGDVRTHAVVRTARSHSHVVASQTVTAATRMSVMLRGIWRSPLLRWTLIAPSCVRHLRPRPGPPVRSNRCARQSGRASTPSNQTPSDRGHIRVSGLIGVVHQNGRPDPWRAVS